MSTVERVFAARLYPRSAIDRAVEQFRTVCPVEVEDVPRGTRVILELPVDADEQIVGEFCNAALAAALEHHVGGGPG